MLVIVRVFVCMCVCVLDGFNVILKIGNAITQTEAVIYRPTLLLLQICILFTKKTERDIFFPYIFLVSL